MNGPLNDAAFWDEFIGASTASSRGPVASVRKTSQVPVRPSVRAPSPPPAPAPRGPGQSLQNSKAVSKGVSAPAPHQLLAQKSVDAARAALAVSAAKAAKSSAKLAARSAKTSSKGKHSAKVVASAKRGAAAVQKMAGGLQKLSAQKLVARVPSKKGVNTPTTRAQQHVLGDDLSDAQSQLDLAQQAWDAANQAVEDAKQAMNDAAEAWKAKDGDLDQLDADRNAATIAYLDLIFQDMTWRDAADALADAQALVAAIQDAPPPPLPPDPNLGPPPDTSSDSSSTSSSADQGEDVFGPPTEPAGGETSSSQNDDFLAVMVQDNASADSYFEDASDYNGAPADYSDDPNLDQALEEGYDGEDLADSESDPIEAEDADNEEIVVGVEGSSFLDRMRRVAPLWGWGLGGAFVITTCALVVRALRRKG